MLSNPRFPCPSECPAFSFLVTCGAAGIAVLALPCVPLPEEASWPYLGPSVGIHFAYFTLVALLARREAFLAQLGVRWEPGFLGGLCTTASYGIAPWAMTVAPIALVAALRETSVIFGTVFAPLFLRERFGALRYLAAGAVAAGAVAIMLF